MEAIAKGTRREATYQDVLDAPEHMVAEIIDGELILSPRPASPHVTTSSQIGADLTGMFGRKPGGAANRPGGWWILDEPELHLGDAVIVPDLAGWRRERMPQIPKVAYFELAPDWACEIVSPSSAGRDRIRKMGIYARESVSHVWLVDPEARSLEVYRLEAGRWVRVAAHIGDEKVCAAPFDAVELDMSEWWIPGEPADGSAGK